MQSRHKPAHSFPCYQDISNSEPSLSGLQVTAQPAPLGHGTTFSKVILWPWGSSSKLLWRPTNVHHITDHLTAQCSWTAGNTTLSIWTLEYRNSAGMKRPKCLTDSIGDRLIYSWVVEMDFICNSSSSSICNSRMRSESRVSHSHPPMYPLSVAELLQHLKLNCLPATSYSVFYGLWQMVYYIMLCRNVSGECYHRGCGAIWSIMIPESMCLCIL